MIDMGNLEGTTAMSGCTVLQFPKPGLLRISCPRSFPVLRLMGARALLDAQVERAVRKRGEVALATLLFVGAIDRSRGRTPRRLKLLSNERLHQFARSLRSFGRVIALACCTWEQPHVSTAELFFGLPKACHPSMQRARRDLRIPVLLPLQISNDLLKTLVRLAQI